MRFDCFALRLGVIPLELGGLHYGHYQPRRYHPRSPSDYYCTPPPSRDSAASSSRRPRFASGRRFALESTFGAWRRSAR